MSKEMYISSSPHETKVAVLEDDQLVEVYFERDTDVGLVGGIYKGRVSRVLPGMQSAFVDIGLERDAFLYVSDFSMKTRKNTTRSSRKRKRAPPSSRPSSLAHYRPGRSRLHSRGSRRPPRRRSRWRPLPRKLRRFKLHRPQ